MPDPQLSTAVNKHYLDKVMGLTDSMDVQASEDIFDARGNKLLAKGARVSRSLQEKLIVHKLTKPLEACIRVDGGVDGDSVTAVARRLLGQPGSLTSVIERSAGSGVSPLAVFSTLRFGNAMSMMLTIADKDNGRALDHAVIVSLLAIAIARGAGLSELDQSTAGMAGLLHDVGELYIDPAYLVPGKRLLPHEWAHLVVHPHTGQMLINELESFPPAVGRAVAEHHERFDGGGYPRRLGASAISAVGQVVSVAEMLAGVLGRTRALERAALALKIIPGEHAKPILRALGKALADSQTAPSEPSSNASAGGEDASRLVARIATAASLVRSLLESPSSMSARARDLLGGTLSRIKSIERALVSTGLDMYAAMRGSLDALDDDTLVFEQEVAIREIQWRLRDIARDLALQGDAPNERLTFVPIINVLDDDFSVTDYRAATPA